MNWPCERTVLLPTILVLLGACCAGCQDDDSPAAPDPDSSDEARSVLRVPTEYPAIQPALTAARAGDTVLVAPGTYAGAGNRRLDFGGRDLVLLSEGGAEVTELDCETAGRAFYFRGGETRSAVIEGFTIRNGSAALAEEPGGDAGGGVRFDDCAPTLRDCRFLDCSAVFGGAVFSEGAAPLFEHCEFRGNYTLELDGGALYLSRGAAELDGCVITGNRARRGGGIYCDASDVRVTGSTVAGNFADEEGGGLYVRRLASLFLERTILWGNGADGVGPEASLKSGTRLSARCTAVDSSAIAGSGSFLLVAEVTADPAFCAPLDPSSAPTSEGSYRLEKRSPCRPGNNQCGVLIGATDSPCASVSGREVP